MKITDFLEEKKEFKLASLLIIAAVIVAVVLLAKKGKKVEEIVLPEIVLESSKMMVTDQQLQLPLTEAEKQQIENVFAKEGVEMTVLKDVSGNYAHGTGWRHFDGEKFYHKVEAGGLSALEKGFFYEGWLVSDEGFFSTGRMAEIEGKGSLYYIVDENKADFQGVVVTIELEDGDLAPGQHILEGSF